MRTSDPEAVYSSSDEEITNEAMENRVTEERRTRKVKKRLGQESTTIRETYIVTIYNSDGDVVIGSNGNNHVTLGMPQLSLTGPSCEHNSHRQAQQQSEQHSQHRQEEQGQSGNLQAQAGIVLNPDALTQQSSSATHQHDIELQPIPTTHHTTVGDEVPDGRQIDNLSGGDTHTEGSNGRGSVVTIKVVKTRVKEVNRDLVRLSLKSALYFLLTVLVVVVLLLLLNVTGITWIPGDSSSDEDQSN